MDPASHNTRPETQPGDVAPPVLAPTSTNPPDRLVARISLFYAAVDLVCLIAMALAVIGLYTLGKPFRRGFFCDDDSIRLNYKNDTVSNLVVLAFSIVVTVFMVVGCEVWQERADGRAGRLRLVAVGDNSGTLPAVAVRIAWSLVAFAFGMAAQLLFVQSGKLALGRLRPHFLDVCQPQPPLSDLCASGNGSHDRHHTYITDYNCTGEADFVKEARMSFPSGHTATAFYTAVFDLVFLATRFHWQRRTRLIFACGALVVVMLAWLLALSRVSDHKHHASDVLGGGVIGVVVAAFTAVHFLRRRLPKVSSKDHPLYPTEERDRHESVS